MLGFTGAISGQLIPFPIPSNSKNSVFPDVGVKGRLGRRPRNFAVKASAENGNGKVREEEKGSSNNGNGEDLKRDKRPILNVKWRDLVDPDPENILAIGLTGVLTWASVQVLWQLFFISFAILVAALKYSFIAALLIFILITLL